MTKSFSDSEDTNVYIHTPTHGAVDYRTVKDSFDRISQGVATQADIRLVDFILKFSFRLD